MEKKKPPSCKKRFHIIARLNLNDEENFRCEDFFRGKVSSPLFTKSYCIHHDALLMFEE